MIIQNIKGGYDYMPSKQNIRNYINNILIKTFKEFGYNSVETPILMYYDILSDKYDEENDILKEIYKLTDQGDRKLGLRYDLTVPFAKLIALNKNEIKMPFKRYEINKVFRDGPVRVGRDREFTQCDVDVVGIDGQLIEAELLTIFIKAFKKLNIDIIIKYNSRKLMTGLILESGIKEELLQSITTAIDKKDKLEEKEFIDYLYTFGLEKENVDKLYKCFDMSLEDLNKEFNNTSNIKIKEGLEEINNLSSILKELGYDSICNFSSSLARGQNYYTGNVFEVYEKNGKIKGSIAAGGRYDNMITNFIDDGNSYPAVGISFGLSSIYELLKGTSIEDNNLDFYIIPINTEAESLKLANKLRNLGFKVDIEMQKKKLKKSLDYANKEKIKYVIILGEEEVKNNKIIIKDMLEKNNIEMKLDEIEKIKKYIKNI